MTQGIITALLALFAFMTALHGVSDYESVYPLDDQYRGPWYRRITRWGYLKVVLIIGTLFFGCLNGYVSWTSSTDARIKQDTQQQTIADQADKLTQSQGLLTSVSTKLSGVARTIDLAEKTLRNMRLSEGSYRASMFPMSGVVYDLINHEGQKYKPLQGDRMEFSLTCRGGPAPDLMSCPERKYGYFIADSDKYPISQVNGNYVFQGSRSTGHDMTFEATTDCTHLRQKLEEAMCEIDLDVTRVGAQLELAQMREEGFPFDSGLTDSAHDDLCRAYELLYGTKCDKMLPAAK